MADREVPQRELRNDISAVLREVEAGNRLRITVRGRPVAELVPTSAKPATLSRGQIEAIITEAPLDAGFTADVEDILGETIEDL